MPKFNAGDLIEALDFTFMPYADIEGVITEPNDRQIAEFLHGLSRIMDHSREMAVETGNVDEKDPVAVLLAMDRMEPDKYVDIFRQYAELYSALCSGFPTPDQFLSVPLRARNLFFTWLRNEVLYPEAATAAGPQAAATPLRSVGGQSSMQFADGLALTRMPGANSPGTGSART